MSITDHNVIWCLAGGGVVTAECSTEFGEELGICSYFLQIVIGMSWTVHGHCRIMSSVKLTLAPMH